MSISMSMTAMSLAPTTSQSSTFFEAAFVANSGSGTSFEAALFESGSEVGGAFGVSNTDASSGSATAGGMCGHHHLTAASADASSGSGSGAGSASLNGGVDLSSLFSALFNMLESGGSTSTGTGSGSGSGGTLEALLEITDGNTASATYMTSSGDGSSTDAVSSTSSGDGSSTDASASSADGSADTNWLTAMFTDMQNMFSDFETAATEASQVQSAA